MSRIFFTKILIFEAQIFLKNSQRQISLSVIANKKNQRGYRINSITRSLAMVLNSKNFVQFSTFSRYSGKRKVFQISEITRHLQKCFTDYDRILGLYENCATLREVATRLSLPFPGGKVVAWKTENIEYIWQPIFFILSPCVLENNGLLNKKILG